MPLRFFLDLPAGQSRVVQTFYENFFERQDGNTDIFIKWIMFYNGDTPFQNFSQLGVDGWWAIDSRLKIFYLMLTTY